jgi:glycosyltransferase involved in cell wall biosynthesis
MEKQSYDTISQIEYSILTVTSPKRKIYLPLLAECVQSQTGITHAEWVIVCHGDDVFGEDVHKIVKQYVDETFILLNITFCEKGPIGHLRNVANKRANGSILVWMDDDDYYSPTRVRACANTFRQFPSALVAGCFSHITYDVPSGLCFKLQIDNHNIVTNNTLAYHKKYLDQKDVQYNDEDTFREEGYFLQFNKEPIAPIHGDDLGLHFSHYENTYNKRWFLWDKCALRNEGGSIVSSSSILICPPHILTKYIECALLSEIPVLDYNIIYYCGYQDARWKAFDSDLGGSEQAVVQLSTHWARLGYKVGVFSSCATDNKEDVYAVPYLYRGVMYHSVRDFNPRAYKNETIIFWRRCGIFPMSLAPVLCSKKIIFDIHNVNVDEPYISRCSEKFISENVQAICVRSNIHRDESCNLILRARGAYATKLYRDIILSKMRVIENGVRESFYIPKQISRNPFRCCYMSCYQRGIIPILKHIWPHVVRMEPRANLHIYYGIQSIGDKMFLDEYSKLIRGSINVQDHFRQGMDSCVIEKQHSSFHLYTTTTLMETDCISIKESVVSGCIPVVLNRHVFRERPGWKLPEDIEKVDENTGVRIASMLVLMMQNDIVRTRCIKDILSACPNYHWFSIACRWNFI